jgi:hypothetical protein
MPQTSLPAPLSLPVSVPSPHKPLCQACGKQMRLVTVAPFPRYTNIDVHDYACECGDGSNGQFFVARDLDGAP